MSACRCGAAPQLSIASSAELRLPDRPPQHKLGFGAPSLQLELIPRLHTHTPTHTHAPGGGERQFVRAAHQRVSEAEVALALMHSGSCTVSAAGACDVRRAARVRQRPSHTHQQQHTAGSTGVGRGGGDGERSTGGGCGAHAHGRPMQRRRARCTTEVRVQMQPRRSCYRHVVLASLLSASPAKFKEDEMVP